MLTLSIVQTATARALASGALQPIRTAGTVIEDARVRFVVRTASSLERKAAAQAASHAADPLGAYEPELFVTDLPPAHYVLLNKFNVLPAHVLIVARRFEPQERLLTVADFAALAQCLAGIDGLGFYNGGIEAGASQARKHLQLVPLPLAPEIDAAVPIEPLLDTGLPFAHAFARLPPGTDPAALHARYRELLAASGIRALPADEGELQSAPYNLLVTRRWMLVVPRRRERFESISVNALGFAGSLFVRRPEELERVRACGPMHVLCAVAGT
jgi:sulfate adenylyltransferase (ADP) / ATP adenylyltransferase